MKILLEHASPAFSPRSPIRGKVVWTSEDPTAESLEIRLIWNTQGKGTQDSEVVETHVRRPRASAGEVDFQFTAPDGPHSFSGKLISLVWAIEVVALPGDESERLELVIAPDGKEILLSTLDKVPREMAQVPA